MLYLYWRVAYGTSSTSADVAAMPDLNGANWRCSAPIAAVGAVDGRLSGKLPGADAQRRRRAARADRARQAAGRRPARAARRPPRRRADAAHAAAAREAH